MHRQGDTRIGHPASPHAPRARARNSARLLVAGFAFVGLLVVAEGVANHYVTSSVEARSWHLERSSVRSVALLGELARDLDRARFLMGDHIMASSPERRAADEKRLADVEADRRRVEEMYRPFVELPDEQAEWRTVSALIDRFDRSMDATLALSRANLGAEAQARWVEDRADHDRLDRSVSALIEMNRDGALDSVARIEKAEQLADGVSDVVRLTALLAIAVLAAFLIRSVGSYEERLHASAEALEARNHDLDAFAGRVAHDLANALGPISMSPLLLRRAAGDAARVEEIAARTERCSRRAAGILDALLAFSRATSETQANESCAVVPAVGSVVEEVLPRANALGAVVEIGDVADVAVRCNPGLLHIVLANLVGNAVKYLEGRQERRVHIAAFQEPSTCRFEVVDTGPGIPEEAQDKIFEPFYRVKGSLAPGSGIGLATVRRIVEARGGRIAVASEPDHGARFVVWLPLADGVSPPPTP